LAQSGKNFCRWHWLGFPRIKARNAAANLRFPRSIRARFRVWLDADEQTISQRDALIRRQHEGVVGERIKGGGHGRRLGQKIVSVEPENCRRTKVKRQL
jgi:hypothetical protein